VKLWAFWRSSASYRVRIALNLKGLKYEIVVIDLLKGQQLEDAYVARNPMRQVPLLELDNGVGLAQSAAILEYLEETYPSPPLLPSDPILRARARQLFEIVNSGIQPFQNTSTVAKLSELGVVPKPWVQEFITKGLRGFEDVARTTAGRFSIGDSPTIADCALVPQLHHARRFEVDLTQFPLLTRIDAACAELPAFTAAHPERQPDAPKS
jgi:maleylpyruvate isomerase